MRIALVNYQDWVQGGMDKVALVQYEELKRRGHEVAFFARRNPNNLQTPYTRYYPDEPDRQHYKISMGQLRRLPRDLTGSFYNVEAARCLGAFLDDFQPDLVHVHGIPRGFSPSLYDAIQERHLPIVQTHHYAKLICPTGRLLKGDKRYCHEMPCIQGNTTACVVNRCHQGSLVRSAISALELRLNKERYLKRPDLHLSPSHYLFDLLALAGVPTQALRRHPNFVDTDRFKPGLDGAQDYFLYFGRLSPEKGMDCLLDAFAPLKGLQLVLAGSGPMEEAIRMRIASERLKHIHCLGHLNEASLVPLIQNARATILPALWGEIFGLSILESMACGRPVIGARVGAIAELIRNGETGLLFQPGHVLELKQAILAMATMDDDAVDRMGEKGLAEVRAQYTLPTHMDRLERFYDELLGQSRPVRRLIPRSRQQLPR